MPSTRKMTSKSGKVFYEISVSRGRGKSRLTRRWYAPDGWSKKAIDLPPCRQSSRASVMQARP
mgnify:CR=1 FL=1